jgi:hypothetical protein
MWGIRVYGWLQLGRCAGCCAGHNVRGGVQVKNSSLPPQYCWPPTMCRRVWAAWHLVRRLWWSHSARTWGGPEYHACMRILAGDFLGSSCGMHTSAAPLMLAPCPWASSSVANHVGLLHSECTVRGPGAKLKFFAHHCVQLHTCGGVHESKSGPGDMLTCALQRAPSMSTHASCIPPSLPGTSASALCCMPGLAKKLLSTSEWSALNQCKHSFATYCAGKRHISTWWHHRRLPPRLAVGWAC